MKRASRFFSEDERKAIGAAVTEAERTTSAEIVPVVATVSGRYDRAEDIFGILVAVVSLALGWVFFQGVRVVEGEWAPRTGIALGLIPILAITIVGFAVGAALATWFPILRLPFVSRKEMRQEVERAAGEAFHRFRVKSTAAGTGIVIFVSLYERMVTVLPADAIAEKVVPGEWEAVRDLVLQGIRERRPGDGFSRAIAKCGEILKPLFPVQPGDVNEISNELRVLN